MTVLGLNELIIHLEVSEKMITFAPAKNIGEDMNEKMRLLLTFACFFLLAMPSQAVPAMPGLWRTITLEDGTKVRAELRGDEFCHFYMDKNRQCYVKSRANRFRKADLDECLKEAEMNMKAERPGTVSQGPNGMRRSPKRVNNNFTGTKKAIVILMQFQDKSFDQSVPTQFGYESTLALYKSLINERNLNLPPFHGSVRDYFIEQSDGKFEIVFDVVGPYTSTKEWAYYGANNETSNGIHKKELIQEAVNRAIEDNVDFSPYDWDDDGNVEEVFVLYAGQGENDGGPEECIWPHMSNDIGISGGIQQTIGEKTVTINTYACTNELGTNHYDDDGDTRTYYTQLSGIGTFCHEFSHCLGYPDMYDINKQYKGNEMGRWDLMCSGSYNGAWNGGHSDWSNQRNGYCPAGYTSFERWWAEWIKPIKLDDPQKVTKIKPLGGTPTGGTTDHGNAYVVYMPGSEKSIFGQYYLLENRECANWDYALPWRGLLITYVHYNATLWENNRLNTVSTSNTHERITNFQACGKDVLANGYPHLFHDTYPFEADKLPKRISDTYEFWNKDYATLINNLNEYYTGYTQYYHYNNYNNNSLDDTTNPQAYYWTTENNEEVKKPLTGQEIWNIEYNYDDNRTVNFVYRKTTAELTLDEDAKTPETPTPGLYNKVTTDRVLQSGKYNTLWLPFNMNEDDIIRSFGEDARVYMFTGATTTGEGADATTTLNFENITRNGIPAYTPVIVTLGSNKTITFDYPMQVESPVTPLTTTADGWQFVGTTQVGTVPQGAFYLKDNKYFESPGGTRIKAYRAYLVAPSGVTLSRSFASRFADAADDTSTNQGWREDGLIDCSDTDSPYIYMDDNNHQQSVETVISQTSNDGIIYNLNGQKVGAVSSSPSLAKGIYVIGGHKYIIK